MAHQFIQQFTIDICFLTGGGISANGISLGTPETANFMRELSKVSKRKICLAPHYKVGMDFFVKSIPIEENDLLITDEETAREEIKKIEERGVKVIVAKVE